MNAARSSFLAGIVGGIAAVATISLRRAAAVRRFAAEDASEEARWEGEGGTVPEVELQSGQQGRGSVTSAHSNPGVV